MHPEIYRQTNYNRNMSKTTKNMGCQQVLLHPDKNILAILEYLCGEANKVFNCSVYYARQVWFKENRFVNQGELCRQMKWNRHFNAMYASSAQQICNGVIESFRSFKQLLRLRVKRGINKQTISSELSKIRFIHCFLSEKMVKTY